ncbi:acyltransferase domain-containing protein, partial [Salinispora arenicola]|uniref:acyltransferase domain-containing protein n=1 Tax=Salinispora arenicola TaxID=168697 RepID=UPI0027DDD23D
AALLTEEGVRRDAMLGHSIGEITSAYLAGVFDLPSALRLVALRGRLMDEQPAGLMVSVALGESELAAVLPEGLSVGAVNAPDLCVVSGPEPATTQFVEAMAERQVPTRRLHTSHAFHSADDAPGRHPVHRRALRHVPEGAEGAVPVQPDRHLGHRRADLRPGLLGGPATGAGPLRRRHRHHRRRGHRSARAARGGSGAHPDLAGPVLSRGTPGDGADDPAQRR